MTKALGLTALLAMLLAPGSPARAAPRAKLTITGAGTGTPPSAARRQRVHHGVLAVTVQPAPASGSRPVVRLRAVQHAGSVGPGRLPARHRRRLTLPPPARLAGDPGVTIADFHFTPSSTTVHVGDTITWTNDGPSSHSATAGNGSFNTGILKPGQSATHTFTQAGTFTYYCQIHPFMHGTIVVLASTTTTTSTSTQTSAPAAAPTTTGSASTATTTTDTTTAAAAGGQPTLPLTGLDVLSGLVAGLVLIGVGVALRRTLAP